MKQTRKAGLLIPVFSMSRTGDLGIGDTRAMIEWIELLAEAKVGLLQLLPINETGVDDSPYNAISSVALDPIYLTMEEVPGIDVAQLQQLQSPKDESSSLVGKVIYADVRAKKEALLEKAWASWPQADESLQREFLDFVETESDWLNDFADFRVLMEMAGSEAWDHWPEEWQSPQQARKVAGQQSERVRYYCWLQWLCFRQWREVRAQADRYNVQLMGDIPIGVSRNSADVFFGRADFDLNWCGGAPPETVFKYDEFIRKWGQNWGIPLYKWKKMKAEDYPWWRRRVDKLTDIFHVFRIDHILGFYRIYAFPWTPDRNDEFLPLSGAEAAEKMAGELPRWAPRPDDIETNCDANRADGEARLRVIMEAAKGAEVIGEDLGMVPDYVRPNLAKLGIPGFRIPHWDFDEDDQVIPKEQLPECSFATYATHDHNSIPAMWEDLRQRSSAKNEDTDDRADAQKGWKALADFAGISTSDDYTEATFDSLIEALFASNSRYAVLMITDIYGLNDRINQPGTVGPHNWSFRLNETATESRTRPFWENLRKRITDNHR